MRQLTKKPLSIDELNRLLAWIQASIEEVAAVQATPAVPVQTTMIDGHRLLPGTVPASALESGAIQPGLLSADVLAMIAAQIAAALASLPAEVPQVYDLAMPGRFVPGRAVAGREFCMPGISWPGQAVSGRMYAMPGRFWPGLAYPG